MSPPVTVSSHLAAPPDRVWELALRSETMLFVAAPLLTIETVGPPLPERWHEGDWEVRLRGPAGLPLGRQTIRIRFPPAAGGVRRLRDDGRGALARRWDHLIEVAPEGRGTRYTDMVAIEAGALTGAVRLCARAFFRHRQRRWRRLLSP